MAMIPTMTARTPSRISEVDDDLSTDAGLGVCVEVDMTGVPFVWPGTGPRLSPLGAENGHWRSCASQYSWAGPRAEGEGRISGRLRVATSGNEAAGGSVRKDKTMTSPVL